MSSTEQSQPREKCRDAHKPACKGKECEKEEQCSYKNLAGIV